MKAAGGAENIIAYNYRAGKRGRKAEPGTGGAENRRYFRPDGIGEMHQAGIVGQGDIALRKQSGHLENFAIADRDGARIV